MKFCTHFLIFVLILSNHTYAINENVASDLCSIDSKAVYGDKSRTNVESNKYTKHNNEIFNQVKKALANYTPCSNDTEDASCKCHAAIIKQDLIPYKHGITKQMIKDSAKYGTRYKIFKHKLYRDADCMFPARCSGVEHFLLRLLPQLPDMDIVINTRDWPQLRVGTNPKNVVFSFSKTADYNDIMYPAWTFWAGGPAISLHPTGIGRWDLLRTSITKAAVEVPWQEKIAISFFRGSRTSDERDALVLLSRREPTLVDAQYTKNQAWKSSKDTLNAEPAKEVTFEAHCRYKYLFNFRGVAASFRLKHLFLCKSLVLHVGNEWNEFFYFALKPWVHYVPLSSYPSEKEIEDMLRFFQKHDELAQQIAERGYEFIWRHLRMGDVECYWRQLLLQYQQLLQYKIVKDDTLIEIKAKPERKTLN